MNGSSGSLISRAMGAAFLDVHTYEAVEADRSATSQAAMVVLLVAISGAIGASGEGSGGMVAGVFNAFAGWFIWAGVTNLVGTRLLGGTADWGELLRTLGFAQAPGILAFLGALPLLGGSVSFVLALWTLVTGVVAIRQALDVSTGKAVLTALISMAVVIAVAVGVAVVLGVGAGVASILAG
ncbi:MAG TPA: YIP1 family protein [Longimicrobiales bacterium]|nr:YIP1 family protein [Longimicrobiales bacterium]